MNASFEKFLSQCLKLIEDCEQKKISGPHFYSDFNQLCEIEFDSLTSEEKAVFHNIILFQNNVLDNYMNYDPEEKEEKEFLWLFGDKKLRLLVSELKILLQDWKNQHNLSAEVINRWRNLNSYQHSGLLTPQSGEDD